MKTLLIIKDPMGNEEIPKLFDDDLVADNNITLDTTLTMRIPANGREELYIVLLIEPDRMYPGIGEVNKLVVQRMLIN